MSKPRCILPGTTWLVTRRTTRRHFLLRPDPDQTVQRIYWYVTALLAEQFGIELHAVQMLSTHVHEVLTDTRGELPRFLQQRNRLFANALKCHRGWPEEVFARGSPNCVALFGATAVLKEIAYTLANCVSAGLTERPEDWPGVSQVADDRGTAVRVVRPSVYFDRNNPKWPPHIEIRLTLPLVLLRIYDGARGASVAIKHAIDAAVRCARTAVVATGHVVRRVAILMRISPESRARSPEPFGEREPTFATAGVSAETARALEERRTFLSRYKNALHEWRAGVRDALFPVGTWRLRQELGVRAGPPLATA